MQQFLISKLLLILHVVLRNNVVDNLAISVDYIYDKCTTTGSIIFSPVSGGSLYWNSAQVDVNATYSGQMNNSHIIGCSILFRGRPQGTFSNYQQLLGLYWRNWTFDNEKNTRESQAQVYFTATLATIKSACGSTCSTGCLIIVDPVTLLNSTYCSVNQLHGTDHTKYYNTDYLQIYFYLLGGLYITSNSQSNNTTALVTAPSMNIIIDYTSFYFGRCYDSSTQYQCSSTQRCIDSSLYCDGYGAVNCGLPTSGNSMANDVAACSNSGALTGGYIFLVIIGALLGAILLFLLAWWCCYRPGYLCWRCARCRNLPCVTKECNRSCISPWAEGKGPNRCLVCRSPPRGHKRKNGSWRPSSGCEACRSIFCSCIDESCCPCCFTCCGLPDDELNEDVVDSYSDYKGKNAYNNPDFYHGSNEWMGYINGDGFHLREAR